MSKKIPITYNVEKFFENIFSYWLFSKKKFSTKKKNVFLSRNLFSINGIFAFIAHYQF